MFISGVTFFFSEADHSVNEGRDPPIITAPLSKNADTRLANPVTFKVFPVTIKEAEEIGWPIPPGAQLVNDPDSPYEASKSSFSFSFVCLPKLHNSNQSDISGLCRSENNR